MSLATKSESTKTRPRDTIHFPVTAKLFKKGGALERKKSPPAITTTKPIATPSRRQAPKPEQEFGRGAKLLCIDDHNIHRCYIPGPPVQGHIYTVREVYTDQGRMGVLLMGIKGPIQADGLEQGFYLSRFRWVQD